MYVTLTKMRRVAILSLQVWVRRGKLDKQHVGIFLHKITLCENTTRYFCFCNNIVIDVPVEVKIMAGQKSRLSSNNFGHFR